MRRNIAKLSVVAVLIGALGCGAVLSSLPKVIAAVIDAQMILDSVEDFVQVLFVNNPDPDKERAVQIALERCRAALSVALRATSGVDKLTKEQTDAAFRDFRTAYEALLILVGPMGVRQAADGEKLGVAAGQLLLPVPLALDPQSLGDR